MLTQQALYGLSYLPSPFWGAAFEITASLTPNPLLKPGHFLFHLRGDLIKGPSSNEHPLLPARQSPHPLCLLTEAEKVSQADMLCPLLFLLGYFSISHLIGLPIERSFSLLGDAAHNSQYQYEHPSMADSRRWYPAAVRCSLSVATAVRGDRQMTHE